MSAQAAVSNALRGSAVPSGLPTGFRPLDEAGQGASLPQGLAASVHAYGRDEEIFGQGEPARYAYKVVSGVVRTYKVTSDGRRQIGDFHLAGDLFGLEASDTHRVGAEVVANASVLIIDRRRMTAIAASDSGFADQLWNSVMRDRDRAQEHLLLLGRRTAVERVATFLLEMAARTSASDTIDLPMSRYDIADHLGLTIETVSRAFTQLEKDGVIALETSRKIRLRNRAALRRLNA